MSGVRSRTSIVSAWIDGWRRVARAPILVGGLILIASLVQGWRWVGLASQAWWPAAVPVHQLWWILGAESYAFGSASGWYLGLGFMPVLNMAMLGGEGVGFVASMILAGGTLDRLARARPTGAAAFSAATGAFFLRFLRLDAVIGAVSWLMWTLAMPWIHQIGLMDGLKRLGPYAIVLLFVTAVGVVGDVARVRAVVEDRRSMLASLGAAIGFIRRRPLRILGLYLFNTVVAVAILAGINYIASPISLSEPYGRAPVGLVLWAHLFFLALTRLGFMATTIAFFQAELAHAGYTARPIPAWPDSPAVEAIAALDGRARDARAKPPL